MWSVSLSTTPTRSGLLSTGSLEAFRQQIQAQLSEREANAPVEEDNRDALIAWEVEQAIARIPDYRTREGYDAWRRKLGMSDEHAWQFERYGVVLQPKQMEFAVWARRCDDPDGPEEVGMGGAKGPGKSFGLFAQAALDDCQRFPNLKVLYLRKTATAAKEQLEDLARHILRHMPGANITRNRIDFPNGSRIIIGGFKDEQQALGYAGVENDALVNEEATQLSAKTHEALRGTNRSSKSFEGKTWRPRRYYSTNPLGVGHAFFKKRFVDNERKRKRGELFDPRQKFIFATVKDNAFVNPEYMGVLEGYTGVQKKAYFDGNWDVSAGAYFDAWNADLHIIPAITDLSWMTAVWCSMDFGYNHLNVVYLHAVDGDGVTYTIDELVHRKRQPEEIAPDIHAWLAQYELTRKSLKWFLVGSDAFAETGRAKATVAQQYLKLGIEMSRADTSPGSRVAGALHMAKLLGRIDADPRRSIPPRWYITSRCPRLAECLPYLETDPHNAEDVLKVDIDAQGNGGDDTYDAARYGLWKPHVTVIAR